MAADEIAGLPSAALGSASGILLSELDQASSSPL
jgi:hypothetical protein